MVSIAELHSVYQAFERAVEEYGPRPFLRVPADSAKDYSDSAIEYSYEETKIRVDQLIVGYAARRLEPGDRVALAMRNYPEWMAAFIGVTSIGAVIVPVNSWGQPADIAYTVEDAGAKLALCDQQRYDGVAERFRDKGIETFLARPTENGHPQSWRRLPTAPFARPFTTWNAPRSPLP